MHLRQIFFSSIVIIGILREFPAIGEPLDQGYYLSDLTKEHDESYQEIFLFSEPAPSSTELSRLIFSPELTREFRLKYVEQFGTVDADALAYRDPKYAEMNDDNRASPTADQASINARQTFGEYMMKRLLDWHLDNYMKSNSNLRQVYEAKDKISHAQVQINPQSKFEMQYSIAGNFVDFSFLNPAMDAKVTMFMDPGVFGPANNIENKLLIGRQLDLKTRVNVSATSNDGIATLEIVRHLRGNLSTNIIGSTWFQAAGISPRETRSAVGLIDKF